MQKIVLGTTGIVLRADCVPMMDMMHHPSSMMPMIEVWVGMGTLGGGVFVHMQIVCCVVGVGC